ncbi:MAG: acyl-CoA dehydrogenase [Rhodospirillaceae bacterium]|nr:acyl-CoA dehydrogenase [Rhodospirillaceae bacterium]|tara:strand:+ start:22051 stop:23217 length:1167 start_codon:yes stop_codon:yes gene_type:complete
MDFSLSHAQNAVVEAVGAVMNRFDDDYWLQADRNARFPEEFYLAIAEGGWLGIAMPEHLGGAGLGVSEAALMMQTVADSGGGMAAASSIHINIFGPHTIVVHGTPEQQETWLPPLIAGRERCCFGVTEPDAGLDTGAITTRAVPSGHGYRISGRKIWTSTAQRADKIMLLARTTPVEQCSKKTDGLSLFYTDLDHKHVDVTEIEKMGRAAVDSNMVFIDDLPVPRDHLIGEEGRGFRYLLHSLNPERILLAAEACGLGRNALNRAAKYAGEREVFGRPIGRNQAIQHPLAQSWVDLHGAELMIRQAAWLYDQERPCGAEANAAKYFAAEAAHTAATRAVSTLGGMGYAREYHVERLLRESMIPKLAPISAQLILCHIAETVLGLPKSY